MDNNESHKYELIRTVISQRQELKYRQERLQYNIYAGVCEKSILAQRKIIFKLQHEIQRIEYKLKHNLKWT